MQDAGMSGNDAATIYEASLPFYDLAKIRVGRSIFLTYDVDTDELLELMYPINNEEELYVRKNNINRNEDGGENTATATQNATSSPEWIAERYEIEYDITIESFEGEITKSLYENGLEAGIPEGLIIEFANSFEWTIDFAYDIRSGDKFKFYYEKRFRHGEYVMPGKILAGKFINNGKEYQNYYFVESEENKGFFDQEGNSVQKMFLKAPLSFKYISSGFTTGLRYVQAFSTYTGHRAIDYAATYGTPIRSVGDGTVTFAGWSSAGYGYLTSIRHNATYSTNYAHQSRIAVKSGQKVRQGDVIGYVGSTGFSTGPHLHYEMVKNGIKINPLNEVLPPGEPIKEENKERFFEEIREFKEKLAEFK